MYRYKYINEYKRLHLYTYMKQKERSANCGKDAVINMELYKLSDLKAAIKSEQKVE